MIVAKEQAHLTGRLLVSCSKWLRSNGSGTNGSELRVWLPVWLACWQNHYHLGGEINLIVVP